MIRKDRSLNAAHAGSLDFRVNLFGFAMRQCDDNVGKKGQVGVRLMGG